MLALGFTSERPGTSVPVPALVAHPALDPFAPITIQYISPSALETFAACPRKWAWSKIDRIPKVQGAGAALGEAVHKQHEGWLRDATPYDMTTRAGELAMATLPLLPAPRSGHVEQEITFEYQGIKFGGKIDWNGPDQPPPHPASRAVVLDHKTTTDLAWAKLQRAELLEHPQAPIYGKWATLAYCTEWVEFRWNYVETKRKTGTPATAKSWHLVHRDEIDQHMVEPVRVARELLHVVQVANAERAAGRPFTAKDVPYNASHCGAFGGCPFRDRCDLSPQEQFTSMTQQSQTIFDRLRQKGAAQSAPAPAAATAPAAQPPFSFPTQTAPAASAPAQSAPAAPPTAAAPPWSPPAQTAPAPAAAPGPTVEGYGGQVNPPESALPPAPAQTAPSAPEQTAPAASAPSTTPAAEPAKRGRGRPPKEASADSVEPTKVVLRTDAGEIACAMLRSGAYTQWQPSDLAAYARAVAGALGAS